MHDIKTLGHWRHLVLFHYKGGRNALDCAPRKENEETLWIHMGCWGKSHKGFFSMAKAQSHPSWTMLWPTGESHYSERILHTRNIATDVLTSFLTHTHIRYSVATSSHRLGSGLSPIHSILLEVSDAEMPKPLSHPENSHLQRGALIGPEILWSSALAGSQRRLLRTVLHHRPHPERTENFPLPALEQEALSWKHKVPPSLSHSSHGL